MADKTKQKALYDKRKAQGLCVDCGKPVDNPLKFSRCESCREYHRGYQQNRRKKYRKPKLTLKEQAEIVAKNKAMRAAAQKMIEDAKNTRKANKCLKCEWANITGSKGICPFPEGSCPKEQKKGGG